MHDGDVQYDLREISSSAKKYITVATNIVLELMHNNHNTKRQFQPFITYFCRLPEVDNVKQL